MGEYPVEPGEAGEGGLGMNLYKKHAHEQRMLHPPVHPSPTEHGVKKFAGISFSLWPGAATELTGMNGGLAQAAYAEDFNLRPWEARCWKDVSQPANRIIP